MDLNIYVPVSPPQFLISEFLALLVDIASQCLEVVLQLWLLVVNLTLQFVFGLAERWWEGNQVLFWSIWVPTVLYVLFVLWTFLLRYVVWHAVVIAWKLVGRHTVLGWLLEYLAARVYRLLWVPPPVVGAEVGGLERDRVLMLGRAFARDDNVTHASVTTGGLTTTRLRRRSRWVRQLETYLGGRPGIVGKLVKGQWEPDHTSSERSLCANALLAMLTGDAKLLGGGVLPCSDPNKGQAFLVVDCEGERRVLVPSLLASLSSYACFRPRSEELLSGLRARAREWFREMEVSPLATVFTLPDTVEMAFRGTVPELLARDRLDEYGVPPSS